jgi:pyruvate/2-oxoacid:ferredoxin oxidoreductase beta subunit
MFVGRTFSSANRRLQKALKKARTLAGFPVH